MRTFVPEIWTTEKNTTAQKQTKTAIYKCAPQSQNLSDTEGGRVGQMRDSLVRAFVISLVAGLVSGTPADSGLPFRCRKVV